MARFTFEVSVLEGIEETAKRMVEVANSQSAVVRCLFGEVELQCSPGQSASEVIEAYKRRSDALKHKRWLQETYRPPFVKDSPISIFT